MYLRTQARFPRAGVTIEGRASQWTGAAIAAAQPRFISARVRLDGLLGPDGMPDFVAVAVGAFADPNFPPPRVSVYEERQHNGCLRPEIAAGPSVLIFCCAQNPWL